MTNQNQQQSPSSGSSPDTLLTHQEVALGLLAPIWRGIASDYKSKYARNIWDQFENNVRSAAYTSRLPRFVQHISTRLGVIIRQADAAAITNILNAGQDRHVLRMLRDEATYLVLIVRIDNDERKEEARLRSGADIPQPKGDLPI